MRTGRFLNGMLNYPQIDPVVFSLGPVTVYWYGVMYLAGFLLGGLLGLVRAGRPNSDWTPQQVWDLLFYVALGVVLGGRFGYALFYNSAHYLQHPVSLLFIWKGGMSFHGGLLGVCVALYLYARRHQRAFLSVADFLAPLCALGLGAGRLGNFINQELWGRVSDVPWAMVFPAVGPPARHPSQLYEAGLEGLVLFAMVWIYSSKPRLPGRVSGLFLIGYAAFRFLIEFFREPDAHLGFLLIDRFSMGQLLCGPMLLIGLWLLYRGRPNSG